MPIKKIILFVSIILIIVVVTVIAYISDDVDRCLDRGGRWNTKLQSCEFSEE